MIGAEGVALRLHRYLVTELPGRSAISPATLAGQPSPPLAFASTAEVGQLGVEQYPALFTLTREMLGMTYVDDLDDGSEAYRVRYQLRLLLWARDESHERVDLIRKRYALMLRELLLLSRTAGIPEGFGFAVDVESIRESYSEAIPAAEGRTIAAVYLDVQVTITEEVAGRPPSGDADSIALELLTLDTPPTPDSQAL